MSAVGMDTIQRFMQPALPRDYQQGGIETFIDLFCGIGGFHYAATALGLQCNFASEIDAGAAAQYAHCHGIEPHGDITRIKATDIPSHDILFAGFPCQPFSIIGNMDGTQDKRGMLFQEIIRILKAKRPAAFILENVKQFATINGGKTLSTLLTKLQALGYGTEHRVLNALDYGLPHKRERVIIVGMADGLHNFVWPRRKSTYKPLADILEAKPDAKHMASERIQRSREQTHTSKHKPAIWHENKAGNVSSYPYTCALRAGASYNYLLVDGKRRFTPRELLRLQGFPERFEPIGGDAAVRKQTGNAVPVPMVRAVIREVLHAAHKNTEQNTNTAPALSVK